MIMSLTWNSWDRCTEKINCWVTRKIWHLKWRYKDYIRTVQWWDFYKLLLKPLVQSVQSLSQVWFLLPSIFPRIRVFSNESVLCLRWPKYWSFSLSISPSNEYSGLISFRMDWLDLLAVQGTLKSLLQHHSSEASVLWCSACFIVHLSHPYMTTGKTKALTRWTFVG